MTQPDTYLALSVWQSRKQEEITHPYLKEKISWGLVPYAQELLFARYLCGDLDEYPPLLWKKVVAKSFKDLPKLWSTSSKLCFRMYCGCSSACHAKD